MTSYECYTATAVQAQRTEPLSRFKDVALYRLFRSGFIQKQN
jgi:hypothetical protein